MWIDTGLFKLSFLMFRKPRDFAHPNTSDSILIPSTGRPPTPPRSKPNGIAQLITNNMDSQATSTTPLLGRTIMVPKRTLNLSAGKPKAKSNGNILNFFKKSEPILKIKSNLTELEDEDSLFLANEVSPEFSHLKQAPTPLDEHPLIETLLGNGRTESFPYNEDASPNKRRRMETSNIASPLSSRKATYGNSRIGPFIDDSDDDEGISNDLPEGISDDDLQSNRQSSKSTKTTPAPKESAESGEIRSTPFVPQLKLESTSIYEEKDFEGNDDFIDDEFPEEGEEYLERKWMEEQRQFELGLEDDGELEIPLKTCENKTKSEGQNVQHENGSVTCPICSLAFDGLTEQVSQYDDLC